MKSLTGIPNNPINHEQCPCPGGHLFTPVYTSPSIHGDQAAHDRELSQIKHSGIANIRQTPKVFVSERPADGFVQILDVVRFQDLVLQRKLAEFPSEISTLLRSDLRRL